MVVVTRGRIALAKRCRSGGESAIVGPAEKGLVGLPTQGDSLMSLYDPQTNDAQAHGKAGTFLLAAGVAVVVVGAVAAPLAYYTYRSAAARDLEATRATQAEAEARQAAVAGRPVPAAAGQAVRAQLTEDQRVAWQKLRRRYAEPTYHVAGYLTTAKGWRMHCTDPDGVDPFGWVNGLGRPLQDAKGAMLKFREPGAQTGLGEAKRLARLLARGNAVKATAVLDLFGGESPAIVEWARDDGEKVVVTVEAPSPNLLDGLRDFLARLQVNADRY